MQVNVYVPGWYVRNEDCDYRGEALACLGRPLRVDGRLHSVMDIHPPTIGVMTLLESMGNRFIQSPMDCPLESLIEAAAVAELRENAIEMTWNEYRPKPLQRVSVLFGKELEKKRTELKNFLCVQPWTGFRMISCQQTSSAEPWVFGARTIANVVSSIADVAGCSWFEALWRVPLTLAGHLAASKAPQDRVRRRKDKDDYKKQMDEAIRRELDGLPHPWQIMDPDSYPPSQIQQTKNPNIEADIEKARKKTK